MRPDALVFPVRGPRENTQVSVPDRKTAYAGDDLLIVNVVVEY